MVIQNKKLTWVLLVAIAIILVAMIIPQNVAYADMGPKESISVNITNLPESRYYGTLLSTRNEGGPYAWMKLGEIESYYDEEFVLSHDEDETCIMVNLKKIVDRLNLETLNLYFAEDGAGTSVAEPQVGTTVNFRWGYYPPSEFVIAIYDLDNDVLYLSNIIKQIYFTSYYSAEFSGESLEPGSKGSFNATLSAYEYAPEWWGDIGGGAGNKFNQILRDIGFSENGIIFTVNLLLFLGRVILTIGVELLIALCFGFDKKSYGIIALTNLITQCALNLFIWLGVIIGTAAADVYALIVGEILVWISEAYVYKKKCFRKDGSKKLIIAYAIVANAVTFTIGVLISLFAFGGIIMYGLF